MREQRGCVGDRAAALVLIAQEQGTVMGTFTMKGGTPVTSASLCESCASAHIIRGFRDSEVITICKDGYPEFRIAFPVHSCTEYVDKGRPTFDEMKKLAIDIEQPATMRRIKGFQNSR